MVATIPAGLKTADVQRFATRATQLVKFRPIITYWCEYYILQQILAKQLHANDEECSGYALQLMDNLEAFKSENTTNDAITDDVAAKAYVESFALETFDRADESQRSNTVTRQTADTFSAASVFLDLLGIWGKLEPEMANKSKFAKFHALRISKAIKAGEDPNTTNPIVEPPPTLGTESADDSIEAELRNLERTEEQSAYKRPTVESVPNSEQPSRPESRIQSSGLPTQSAVSQDQSRELTSIAPTSAGPETPAEPGISVETTGNFPIESSETANSRAGSIGGGYFPAVPDTSSIPGHTDPTVTTLTGVMDSSTSSDPVDFYTQPPAAPPLRDSQRPNHPTSHQMAAQPQTSHLPARAQAPRQATNLSGYTPPPRGSYRTDDESFAAAQKHAKWAISALDYEDVDTAVKELRIALQSLGAS